MSSHAVLMTQLRKLLLHAKQERDELVKDKQQMQKVIEREQTQLDYQNQLIDDQDGYISKLENIIKDHE